MIEATSFAFWAAAPAPGPGGLIAILPYLLILPLLYLMFFRPQQKKQKQWQQMLNSIKSGDRITTTGGIRGTIVSMKEDSMVIRVAPDNLKLEVARNAIASVTQEESPKS
jgi:preprotein translocase subunit YajC